jgi:hypothetical protein
MPIVLVADDCYPQLDGVPEHVHHLALELHARAETVVSLLQDPDRREAMSGAGRVAVESYDWREIADRILAVYRRVS